VVRRQTPTVTSTALSLSLNHQHHCSDTEYMPLTLAQSDLSTCEISDALLKLGVPHGGHIPDIHLISPHSHSRADGSASAGVRLCGRAYTVRMVLASEHDAPKLQGAHFVDLAPEASVVFVSAPPGWSSPIISPFLPPTRPIPFVPLRGPTVSSRRSTLFHFTARIDFSLNVKTKISTLPLVLTASHCAR
jgi:hypothetical protein